jgi:transcriptional regulator with XRE-family HTH domain
MTKRKKTGYIDPEFGVKSELTQTQNLVSEAVELMQYRIDQLKKLSDEDVRKARLLQLRFKMERYLEDVSYESNARFSELLEGYVDALFDKRSDFATEFGISAVMLSQYINKHREPNIEFVSKLTTHTLNSFKSFADFPKTLWFEVYYKDKLREAVFQFNESNG